MEMSLSFLFLSLTSYGHTNPILPLVTELVRRGHQVTYLCGKMLQANIESTGAQWYESRDMPPPQDMSETVHHPDNRLLDIAIKTCIADLAIVENQLANNHYDAVAFETFSLAGPIIADRRNIPGIQLWASFAETDRVSYLPAKDEQTRSRLWGPTDKLLRDHGIYDFRPSLTQSEYNISFLPQFFQDQAQSFTDNFHFIGPTICPRIDDESIESIASIASVACASEDRPLIFISLGTVFRKGPDFFAACIRALDDGAYRVVMSIGEHISLTDLPPIPDNFIVKPFLPQLTILSQAKVFVSHAGMNSVLEGICHALPFVLFPQQEEQSYNAHILADLGLGVILPPDCTDTQIRAAIDQVYHNPSFADSAQKYATIIQQCGGASYGADIMESIVTAKP